MLAAQLEGRLPPGIEGLHFHALCENDSHALAAFAWETGYLVSTVLDVVENQGFRTAILDVSFTAHLPDCLEMPYQPRVLGATTPGDGKPSYRLGGVSCLAGNVMDDWSFDRPVERRRGLPAAPQVPLPRLQEPALVIPDPSLMIRRKAMR